MNKICQDSIPKAFKNYDNKIEKRKKRPMIETL